MENSCLNRFEKFLFIFYKLLFFFKIQKISKFFYNLKNNFFFSLLFILKNFIYALLYIICNNYFFVYLIIFSVVHFLFLNLL